MWKLSWVQRKLHIVVYISFHITKFLYFALTDIWSRTLEEKRSKCTTRTSIGSQEASPQVQNSIKMIISMTLRPDCQ